MNEDPVNTALGFRSGDRGTHSSRTMMLSELTQLLAAVPSEATHAEYRSAIVEENVLGKKSKATRKLTAQRLSELYGLSPENPLFRNLRKLWRSAALGRPALALLCAAARDPLLRTTASCVMNAPDGKSISKLDFDAVLATAYPGRFNDSIRNKIARNAASTWTQTGHLTGRTKKVRSRSRTTLEPAAFSLFLGFLCGSRGPALFTTFWASLLDSRPEDLMLLAEEASASGLLNLRRAGPVVEVTFPGWLAPAEEESLK